MNNIPRAELRGEMLAAHTLGSVSPRPLPGAGTTASTRFHTTGILLVLSAVALVIRVTLAARSGLWRDEGLFLFVTRADSWSAMLDFIRLHESHPPLFYAIMRVWISIAGTSHAAAVALPVALGVALVPAIFVVGASLFSVRVGIIAATFAALSPALAEHSALVRPYSLLPLLALFSSYTLVRGLERGERRVWLAHAAATLAMLYTHNWGLLVLGGQWVAALSVLTIGSGQRPREAARAWCVSQLVVVIGYLPWVPWLVYQTRHAGHAPISLDDLSERVSFVAGAVLRLLQATIMGYLPLDDAAILASAARAFSALLLLFAVIGAALWFRARRAAAHDTPSMQARAPSSGAFSGEMHGTALIVLIAVPASAWTAAVLLSPRSNLVLVRCMVTLAPLLILSLAYWLGKRRAGALGEFSLAAAAVLVATYGATLYSLAQLSRSNAREIAAAVTARTHPSDLLIIAPEWLASSFNLYYAPAVEQIDFPHFGREGAIDFVGIRDRTADPRTLALVRSRIAQARQAGRRVWLITDRAAVLDLTPEETSWAVKSPSYYFVGIARTNQIRTELLSIYGQPDTSLAVHTPPPRFEHLRALLFAVAESTK